MHNRKEIGGKISVDTAATSQCLNGLFVLRAFELKRAKARIIPSWPMRLAESIPYHLVLVQTNMGDEGPTPYLTTFTRQDIDFALSVTFYGLLPTKEVAR
jgi:hypothetical protein